MLPKARYAFWPWWDKAASNLSMELSDEAHLQKQYELGHGQSSSAQIWAVTLRGAPRAMTSERHQPSCGNSGWHAICIVKPVDLGCVIRKKLLP